MNKSSALELAEQFQLLRARVENLTQVPRSVFVSAALPNDGKSVCAYGLALEFEAAGYSTLLVDLDYRQPTMKALVGLDDLAKINSAEALTRLSVPQTSRKCAMLSLTNSKLCMSASRSMVNSFLLIALKTFEKVVVLGPTLLASGVGLLFASECDGVILTTKKGRSVSATDRALVETLASNSVTFLGVVSVASHLEVESLLNESLRYSDAKGSIAVKTRDADKPTKLFL